MYAVVVSRKAADFYLPQFVVGDFWSQEKAQEYADSDELKARMFSQRNATEANTYASVVNMSPNATVLKTTPMMGDLVTYQDRLWFVQLVQDNLCILQCDRSLEQCIAETKHLTL